MSASGRVQALPTTLLAFISASLQRTRRMLAFGAVLRCRTSCRSDGRRASGCQRQLQHLRPAHKTKSRGWPRRAGGRHGRHGPSTDQAKKISRILCAEKNTAVSPEDRWSSNDSLRKARIPFGPEHEKDRHIPCLGGETYTQTGPAGSILESIFGEILSRKD